MRVNDQKNILATVEKKKGNPIVISLNDDLTRFTIYRGNSYLSLAGVEVLGHIKSDKDKNITGQGKAYQPDNYPDNYGLAHLAIDENTDGEWCSKSVTHTSKTGKSFWW